MKKIVLIALPILSVIFLTGCNKHEVKTKSYYDAHIDEREAKIKECKDNPSGMKDDPECANALHSHIYSGDIDLTKTPSSKKY